MNPIFSYQASDELTVDAWKSLADAVTQQFSYTLDSTKALFNSWEGEFKVEVDKPLPGAWRSAKSVILSAIKHDVPLYVDGSPRGKTAVEVAIKAVKGATVSTNEKDPEEVFRGMLDTIIAYATKHGIDYKTYIFGAL